MFEIANQLVKPLAGGGVIRGGLEVNPLTVGLLSERGEGVCEHHDGSAGWAGRYCQCHPSNSAFVALGGPARHAC